MRPAKKTKKRSATTTICSCCDNTTAKKSRSTPTSPPPSISTAIPVQETGTSTGPSNAHNGSGNNTIQHIQGVDFNPGPVPPNEVVLPHQQPPQVPGPVPPNAVVLPHQQPLQVPFNYSDDSSSEDEVDPPANLQEILSTHMMGLLPDTGMHYAEPISTPILPQIKKSLCKDIWKGKYVELSSLLPVNSASQSSNFTLQLDKHAHISIQPSTRCTKITSIEVWTSAFIRYVSVRTHKYPGETQQLLKYMEIIRDLATRCPGPAFQYYDNQFRLFRASVPLPWDRIHTEFWLMASTLNTNTHNPQSFRPSRPATQRRSFPSNRPKRFVDNVCWNFNKPTHCQRINCPHPHICGFCRGPHTAFNCSYSSKEQASQSLSGKRNPSSSGPKPSKPL